MRTLSPILALLIGACAAGDAPSVTEHAASLSFVNGATAAEIARGQRTLNQETFGGNGRTCASCHITLEQALMERLPLAQATFDLSPLAASQIFATRPRDALFRPLDSDDGTGATYHRLAEDALVHVHITLAPGITVDESDEDVERLPDGRIRLTVLRSAPSLLNIGLADFIMWDGREVSLEQQAVDATHEHFQPGREPTAGEARDIAQFERQLYSRPELARYAAGGPAPSLPACNSPSSCRGRTFFEASPILASDMAHRGLCATCHSGPMLDSTNQFNPVQPPEPPLADGSCPQLPLPTVPRDIGPPGQPQILCFHRFSNNVVSEHNAAGLREHTFRFVDPFFGPIVLRSPDPGHLLVSGNACEFPAACFLNPGSTQSIFRISSLWGVSLKHRFLHDNSARTLREVLAHLQIFFHETAVGLAAFGDPNAAAFEISDQDADDIVAFLNLL